MNKTGFINRELVKIYGNEKTDVIVGLAKKHYQECQVLCKDVSKGERIHLEDTILPATAVYKALLEVDKENAIKNVNDIIIALCEKAGSILNSGMKIPGATSVFMKLLPKMAVKLFGRECGFDYINFEASSDILQMDMTQCPYVKYAKLFGVEELMSVFCNSDFATYGKLDKISFRRTKTLGTGGNMCDFKFIRNE